MELQRILNHDGIESMSVRQCKALSVTTNVPLRVGKWTPEEEAFASELIEAFLNGLLDIPEGVSLRLFLARKLFCPPMRITTKLSTNQLGGKPIRKRLGQLRYFPSSLIGQFDKHLACKFRCDELEAKFRSRENFPQIKYETRTLDEKSSTRCKSKRPTRSGSWTREEEEYALGLISAFQAGVLDLTAGTTLRSYLAEHLCCDKMRITKKMSYGTIGDRSIPSRLGRLRYRAAPAVSPTQSLRMLSRLESLRRSCFAIDRRHSVQNSI